MGARPGAVPSRHSRRDPRAFLAGFLISHYFASSFRQPLFLALSYTAPPTSQQPEKQAQHTPKQSTFTLQNSLSQAKLSLDCKQIAASFETAP